MERLLAAHRSEVARTGLRVAAGIALDLVRSLVHTAILDVRQAWREVEPVREIRRAVLGYLATPAHDPGRRPKARRPGAGAFSRTEGN